MGVILEGVGDEISDTSNSGRYASYARGRGVSLHLFCFRVRGFRFLELEDEICLVGSVEILHGVWFFACLVCSYDKRLHL